MTVQLDSAYRAQRQRLRAALLAQAARLWSVASPKDESSFLEQMVPLITAGQVQTVRLVDAYMAIKTLHATGEGDVKGLDAAAYSVEALRGKPALEVYARPFAAVGAALAAKAEFSAAMHVGQAVLKKLATTDLQLAQTYSARDWMRDEPKITGYQRVTSGGCGLCEAASTQLYGTEDLMPIHEHCQCDVAPYYGDRAPQGKTIIDPDKWEVLKEQAQGDLSAAALSRLKAEDLKLPEVLRARRDDELGLRLVDGAWKEAVA